MKKLLVLFFTISAGIISAQFRYQGVGIFGALTQSAHYYTAADSGSTDYRADYPQSHISKERFSWGAGLFLELGGSRARWQTELEYANKGANEREVLNRFTGERAADFVPNKYRYIQWNNYLKLYYPLGGAHWYVLAGARLEYLLGSTPAVFTVVSADFPKFWFSGDLGLGYEVHLFRNFSAFFETHWNPDVITHKHNGTAVRNRTFEYRLGIVMRPKKRSVDDCNAPVYRGPAY